MLVLKPHRAWSIFTGWLLVLAGVVCKSSVCGQWAIQQAVNERLGLAGARILTSLLRVEQLWQGCDDILRSLVFFGCTIQKASKSCAYSQFCDYSVVESNSTGLTFKTSNLFSFLIGCRLKETADNVQHLLYSNTHFLPVEEAAVPACPLIPRLCRRAGGLWTHGTCQTPPLYHCNCNGHTR